MEKTKQNTVVLSSTDLERFRSYLTERENAPATTQKYLTDIRTFFRYLDGNLEITKERLLDYKGWLMSRYAVSSVNSMIVALNQFLTHLELGRLKLKRVKIQRQLFVEKEKELTKPEYLELLKTAKARGQDELALIMETICTTGIRISELRFFTAQHVKKGRIEVHNKGKYRIVLLPRTLQLKLLSFMRRRGIRAGYLFRTRNGNPKVRSNIWSAMKALARACRVDARKIFPHNLRHLFARTFYQATKNLVTLADILGHSNLEVTRIYTSTSLDACQKSIENLGLFCRD